MYATIQCRAQATASTDELARAGHALGTRLSAAPGFVACLLLTMPGSYATVCIFEDEASLAADDLVAVWASADGESGWITGEVLAQRGL